MLSYDYIRYQQDFIFLDTVNVENFGATGERKPKTYLMHEIPNFVVTCMPYRIIDTYTCTSTHAHTHAN